MRSPIVATIVLVLACRARGAAPGSQSAPTPPAAPPSEQAASQAATPGVADTAAPAGPDSADLLVALHRRLRALGEDRATIRSRLGEPRAATRETHPNPTDATEVDTLVHWKYDGLDFTFQVFTRDVVADTRAVADYGPIASLTQDLRTWDLARARFGLEHLTMRLGDTTMVAYDVPGSGTITLHFVGGRLVQVGAQPFVD